MAHIVILSRETIHRLPPIASLVVSLVKSGCKVSLITSGCSPLLRKKFDDMDVSVFAFEAVSRIGRAIGKAHSWLSFRKYAIKTLTEIGGYPLIWVGSGDTALAMGRYLFNKRYVLHLHELYDQNYLYKKILPFYARNANVVVVPDECRASIIRVWYELKQNPIVLPNKPFFDFDEILSNPTVGTENESLLKSISNRKLILYQARMVRMDLLNLGVAIDNLDEFVLGIMGDIRDSTMFKRLIDECRNMVHFKYIPAPYHLAITSKAHIGVLLYNYESLNNIFCAPNKIWEYSAFSKPTISNELPMIEQKMKMFKMGEVFDWSNVDSIANAIINIDGQYRTYSDGAKSFYESFDMVSAVEEIIRRATN